MERVQGRTPKCPHSPSFAGVELSVNNYNDDFTLITSPGSVTSLSCLAQNRSQAEELRWYREDSQVDLKDENKMNISYICISPVSESDNGVTFTCKLVRDQSVQVSVVLDVRCECCYQCGMAGWALSHPKCSAEGRMFLYPGALYSPGKNVLRRR